MTSIRIASYILITLHFLRKVIRRTRGQLNIRMNSCFNYNPGETNYTLKVSVFYRSANGESLLALLIHTESSADGNKLFDYLFNSMGESWKPYIYLFNDNTDILLHMDVHLTNEWTDIKKSAPLYVPNEGNMLWQKVKNYASGNLSDKIAITLDEICRI